MEDSRLGGLYERDKRPFDDDHGRAVPFTNPFSDEEYSSLRHQSDEEEDRWQGEEEPLLLTEPPFSPSLSPPKKTKGEQFFSFCSKYGQDVAFYLGLLVLIPFLCFGISDPDEESEGWPADGPNPDDVRARTAGVTVMMGLYWVTEAIPIAATSLFPLFWFPFLGIMSSKTVCGLYFSDTICLFIATNIVGLAMEKYRLHERIAIKTLIMTGKSPKMVVFGIMLVTATLSMFMSNTGTTTVMAPLVVSLVCSLREEEGEPKGDSSMPPASLSIATVESLSEQEKKFLKGALLATAYSASVGGAATLIGTGTNLAFKALFEALYPDAPEITFATWFYFSLPLVIICLFVVWGWLVWLYIRDSKVNVSVDALKVRYNALGPIKAEEWVITIDLMIMMILWLTRSPFTENSHGWGDFINANQEFCSCDPAECGEKAIKSVGDSAVAVGGALLLFIAPTFKRDENSGWSIPVFGTRMIDWKDCKGVSWGVALLLAAGYALASAFTNTGLSNVLGSLLSGLGNLPLILGIFLTCLFVSLITEFMSNVAMANLMLPIVAQTAEENCENPLSYMIPVTLACSFAFMMPAATPPNAIVFSYNTIKVSEMVKTGALLDFVCVILLSLYAWALSPLIWDFKYDNYPEWAGTDSDCLYRNATDEELW